MIVRIENNIEFVNGKYIIDFVRMNPAGEISVHSEEFDTYDDADSFQERLQIDNHVEELYEK